MSVQHHRIHFAERLDLGALPAQADAGLHLVRASGRAVQLDLPPNWLSLWLPLRGPLRLEAADSAWDLAPGHLQVWRDSRVRSSARGPCWWLCLCGPESAWKPHLDDEAAQPQGSDLCPREGAAPRDARRLLGRLGRVAHTMGTGRRRAGVNVPRLLLRGVVGSPVPERASSPRFFFTGGEV